MCGTAVYPEVSSISENDSFDSPHHNFTSSDVDHTAGWIHLNNVESGVRVTNLTDSSAGNSPTYEMNDSMSTEDLTDTVAIHSYEENCDVTIGRSTKVIVYHWIVRLYVECFS